jgi:hypothetical protein
MILETGALFELSSPNRLLFPDGEALGEPDKLGLSKVVLDGDDVNEGLDVSVWV